MYILSGDNMAKHHQDEAPKGFEQEIEEMEKKLKSLKNEFDPRLVKFVRKKLQENKDNSEDFNKQATDPAVTQNVGMSTIEEDDEEQEEQATIVATTTFIHVDTESNLPIETVGISGSYLGKEGDESIEVLKVTK